MSELRAKPTVEGIQLLQSGLSSQVKEFVLIGHKKIDDKTLPKLLQKDDLTFDKVQSVIFYRHLIESSYYDEQGILTYQCLIPYANDFEEYLYACGLVAMKEGQVILVSVVETPRVSLIKGIGGTISYKLAFRGQPGEILFKVGDFLTHQEWERSMNTMNQQINVMKSDIGQLRKELQDLSFHVKRLFHQVHSRFILKGYFYREWAIPRREYGAYHSMADDQFQWRHLDIIQSPLHEDGQPWASIWQQRPLIVVRPGKYVFKTKLFRDTAYISSPTDKITYLPDAGRTRLSLHPIAAPAATPRPGPMAAYACLGEKIMGFSSLALGQDDQMELTSLCFLDFEYEVHIRKAADPPPPNEKMIERMQLDLVIEKIEI